MILSSWRRTTVGQTIVVLALLIGSASVTHAQKREFDVSYLGSATVIEQAGPAYPPQVIRKGQRGWVRMHFVVTPDGHAIDPIIIDSSGGAGFEEEARKATAGWRFEAPASGAELPNNLVNIRSKKGSARESASRDFMRRYRRIVTHLYREEVELARLEIDATYAKGGWNLYESVMFWLMAGRVDGAEGNTVGKLEKYRRALAVSNRKSLNGEGRREALVKIFGLEDQFGHYAHATATFAQLEKEAENSAELAEFGPRAAEIAALMASEKTLVANATIYSPCDCDTGEPLWYYRPERRTFSFANLNGNVQRFEARCDSKRIRGDVVEGTPWTLAPDWGSCRVFVFGDEGATFDFLEHLHDSQEESTGDAAVARSHVLD